MRPIFYLLPVLIMLCTSCKKNNSTNHAQTDPYGWVDDYCGTYYVHAVEAYYDTASIIIHTRDTDRVVVVTNTHTTGSPSKGTTLPVIFVNYNGTYDSQTYFCVDQQGSVVTGAGIMGTIQKGHIDMGFPIYQSGIHTKTVLIKGDKR